MSIKKHIPNALTCCNLISGCIATGAAFEGDFEVAMLFIIVGAGFDFFDGFVARLLKVSSPIGKELDSLADDITFGFAPATIVFALLMGQGLPEYVPFLAFLIAAFSALRLAKFNLDERQAMGFIGLPTPANALFWGSLAITLQSFSNEWMWIPLVAGIFVSSFLLVCELPMFALKFHDYSWKNNKLRYFFIAASLLTLIGFYVLGLGTLGFAAVIVLYVILSVVANWQSSCK